MNTAQQIFHWMRDFNMVCCLPAKKDHSYIHDQFDSLIRASPQDAFLMRDEFSQKLSGYIRKLLSDDSSVTYEQIYDRCERKKLLVMQNRKTMSREGVRKYIVLIKFQLGLIDHKQGKPMSDTTKTVISMINDGKTNSEIRGKLNLKSNHVAALRKFAFDRKLLNHNAVCMFEKDRRKTL